MRWEVGDSEAVQRKHSKKFISFVPFCSLFFIHVPHLLVQFRCSSLWTSDSYALSTLPFIPRLTLVGALKHTL
jgi:hypothetical protein